MADTSGISSGNEQHRDRSFGSILSSLPAGLIAAAIITVIAFFFSDVSAWSWLYGQWTTNPDNSHGLLVPAFAGWLLWQRKQMIPTTWPPVSWLWVLLGCGLVVFGILFRCSGIYTRTISYEAASVIPCIAGIIVICFGLPGVLWAWPAVIFLGFMIPIPSTIGGSLSGILQSIATISSTFLLQTIGIPAVSEGNVIWLTNQPLGVAQACSGLRMMTSFFALATGMALVIERPIWEKAVIILSAPLIAITSNVLRISATAIAYEFGNEKMAELIFHDLAGWLMMPVGLLLLWAELFLLSKLFQEVERERFFIPR